MCLMTCCIGVVFSVESGPYKADLLLLQTACAANCLCGAVQHIKAFIACLRCIVCATN